MVDDRNGAVAAVESYIRAMLVASLDDASFIKIDLSGEGTVIMVNITRARESSEFSRVIGRRGQTINAIRRLAYIFGLKLGYKVIIEVEHDRHG